MNILSNFLKQILIFFQVGNHMVWELKPGTRSVRVGQLYKQDVRVGQPFKQNVRAGQPYKQNVRVGQLYKQDVSVRMNLIIRNF